MANVYQISTKSSTNLQSDSFISLSSAADFIFNIHLQHCVSSKNSHQFVLYKRYFLLIGHISFIRQPQIVEDEYGHVLDQDEDDDLCEESMEANENCRTEADIISI